MPPLFSPIYADFFRHFAILLICRYLFYFRFCHDAALMITHAMILFRIFAAIAAAADAITPYLPCHFADAAISRRAADAHMLPRHAIIDAISLMPFAPLTMRCRRLPLLLLFRPCHLWLMPIRWRFADAMIERMRLCFRR